MSEFKKAMKLLCSLLKLTISYEGDYFISANASNLKLYVVNAITFQLGIQTLVGKAFQLNERTTTKIHSGEIQIDDFLFQYEAYYRFVYDFANGYWEIWEVREFESRRSPLANELIQLVLKLL